MANFATLVDDNLTAKASAAVTSSARATIKDIGAGLVTGRAIIDISAIKVSANDEEYNVIVQGSSTSDFSSNVVELAMKRFGPNEVTTEDADSVAGRFGIPFSNAIQPYATPLRYIALYTEVAGTSPSITYSAFFTKD